MTFKFGKGHAVIIKFFCMAAIGALAPFLGLLKPHQDAGTWPNGVAWLVTGISACIAIANVGIAFTSSSFKDWMDTNKVAQPPTPAPLPVLPELAAHVDSIQPAVAPKV